MGDIKSISKIVRSWIAGTHHTKIFKSDKHADIVKAMYNVCGNSVRKYIKSNITKWKVGGDSIVVVIDKYADTSCQLYSEDIPDNGNIILGIAEVKDVPPRYYFQILKATSNASTDVAIYEAIKLAVRPETIIVIDDSLISFELLELLKQSYKVVVTTSMLQEHNTADENIIDHLNVIWEGVVRKCSSSDIFDIEQTLLSLMWTQKFGENAFNWLMYEIC